MDTIPTQNAADSAGEASADSSVRLREIFDQQKSATLRDPFPDWRARDQRLASLAALVHDNAQAIVDALNADFGHRSPHETRLLEIFPSLEAIRHARRHLKRWMRPERRMVSPWFLPAHARIIPQPLGVVGVIAPWNYPIFLAVGPLVAALAAGNRVMLKMSEYAPATAALVAALVAQHFSPDEVAVVQGDASVAQRFVQLPFGHLLFTGSIKAAQDILRAVAGNLTPVTLELGGKSPAIIGPEYPMAHAAERVMIGKCLNAGQTCVAPDYVLLPAGKEEEFVDAARRTMARCYPDIASTPDYSAIINPRHYERLIGYLDDAKARGARLVNLAASPAAPDSASRRIPPIALLDVNPSMLVMQEEIFGPLLPIAPYESLDAAIEFVKARPPPLSLYYFDRNAGNVDRVLKETLAGGVTINDTIWHIAQDNLPFGGVGASGMGHYHGREGFEAFSKRKPIFFQSRVTSVSLFKPPYGQLFDTLVKLLIR